MVLSVADGRGGSAESRVGDLANEKCGDVRVCHRPTNLVATKESVVQGTSGRLVRGIDDAGNRPVQVGFGNSGRHTHKISQSIRENELSHDRKHFGPYGGQIAGIGNALSRPGQ